MEKGWAWVPRDEPRDEGSVQSTWEELFDRGIERCRRGAWEGGLTDLSLVLERAPKGSLQGLFYSYLGYAVAKVRGQRREGIRLCRHAIKMEFYQPEAYVNLARACLLDDQRRSACSAIRDGLKIDPDHPELLDLWHSVGQRRRPVLPFLSRRNLLNRILGRVRHDLRRDRRAAAPATEGAAGTDPKGRSGGKGTAVATPSRRPSGGS